MLFFPYIVEGTQGIMLAQQTLYHSSFILKLGRTKLPRLSLNFLYIPGSLGFCCLVFSPSQVAEVTGLQYLSGFLLLFPELRLEH